MTTNLFMQKYSARQLRDDITQALSRSGCVHPVKQARLGAGIARIGAFSVTEDLRSGALVPLLEAFNPDDREPIHAVFVGGAAMPARVRAFVDFLLGHHTV